MKDTCLRRRGLNPNMAEEGRRECENFLTDLYLERMFENPLTAEEEFSKDLKAIEFLVRTGKLDDINPHLRNPVYKSAFLDYLLNLCISDLAFVL